MLSVVSVPFFGRLKIPDRQLNENPRTQHKDLSLWANLVGLSTPFLSNPCKQFMISIISMATPQVLAKARADLIWISFPISGNGSRQFGARPRPSTMHKSSIRPLEEPHAELPLAASDRDSHTTNSSI